MERGLQNYVDFHVKPVMVIKNGYGYRVILKYMDGSERVQQKAGFTKERDAIKARDITIAELHTGTYIVYSNTKVCEYMDFWIEEDIKRRITKHSTFQHFSGTVKNHIKPYFGKKKMSELTRADIQALYNDKTEYSVSVAKQVKTIMNISLRFAVSCKVIAVNVAEGIDLPKTVKKKKFHERAIEEAQTINMQQMQLLLERSKSTPIHMQVLLCTLMGLRCSEMNGVKYSDINYVERKLTVQRQLGKKMNANKEDYPAKTLTKQEIGLKTESSYRELPIPDVVFEAIMEERKRYEKNRSRHKREFQDLDYICCSSYGRARSRSYHWPHYKKLLKDCGLPDIRWHDLRSSYCTLLIKNDFSPKAVSKLMGHAKEIITIDTYTDSQELIIDGVPELQAFIDEVLPSPEEEVRFQQELLEIVVDTTEYIHE